MAGTRLDGTRSWARGRRPLAAGAGVAVGYLVVHELWDPPAGIVVQGALLGGVTALLSLGIALVYRANRIVNFAQGDLGAVPGALSVLLIVSSGASWLLAFTTGVVAALVLGAVVEIVVVRRFVRAPRLVLTVATIGLAQVLAGVGLLLPRWFHVVTPPQSFPAPFDVAIHIDPITFGGNDVIAAAGVPVAFVALGWLLRRTRTGIAIRASAERPERAALIGVPVARLGTFVWMLASLLGFLAVFLRAGIVGLPIGTVLGPAILLRALAAAVVGRMERLPTIAVAAIGLGIVEQSAVWGWGQREYVDAVLFVIVMVALLVTPAGSGLRGDDDTSAWRAVREARPIPRALAALPEVRWTRRLAIGTACVALVVLPALLSPSETNRAAAVVIFGIIGLSLLVLTGWAGEVSLGQMAFVAMGAAVGGSLTARWGFDLASALVVAGVAGAGIACLVGAPVLRRRGLSVAVATLAFALATSSYLLDRVVFGAGGRLDWLPPLRVERPSLFGFIDVASETRYYFVCIVTLVLAVLAVRGLRGSRMGRVLLAVRENERAATAFGVATRRATLGAFAVSGFLAAFAGALFVHHQNALQNASYAPAESLAVFAMVVIGGLGSVTGVLLGALYVRGVTWFLSAEWQILVTGAGVLVVLALTRGGLGALLAEARDAALRRLAARRRLIVPSLVPEDAARPPRTRVSPTTTAVPRLVSPLLSVRGLEAGYGALDVLFGVDLDVAEGEIVALLGTNGAGKSTLLRVVAGLLAPRRGSVLLADRDVSGVPAHRLAAQGVSLAPGREGVFPTLSVDEHLSLAAGRGHGRTAASDSAPEVRRRALDTFPALARRAGEQAGNLSGGEQQMLSLALALAAHPRLLLVDELSLGLSPAVLDELLDGLAALRADGVGVLLVDQSIEVARRIAHRAYFLEKGVVRFAGETESLLDRPDLLRAVFLGDGLSPSSAAPASPTPRVSAAPRVHEPPEAARGPRLEVRALRRRFGGVVALDGVSFRAGAGEVLGVLGPNGAGKTTLLDVVSGFTHAESGAVVLVVDDAELDVTHLPAHRRARAGLGRSFQDARLFPALTVRETVAVALERSLTARGLVAAALHLPSVARSERGVGARVDELLELLGLETVADKFGHELSTGTRRIVDLACALADRPAVLLLDEPASGIAQPETEALASLLLRVRDELGATLVVVEHDVALLRAVADRMLALDLGRVVADGPPDTVLHDPAVVAAYLGTA